MVRAFLVKYAEIGIKGKNRWTGFHQNSKPYSLGGTVIKMKGKSCTDWRKCLQSMYLTEDLYTAYRELLKLNKKTV